MTQETLHSAASSSDDDFLSSLRIDGSLTDSAVGVRKVLTTVPLRKPRNDEWFRVHPDHMLDCYAVELKTEGETYIATPAVAAQIPDCSKLVRLRQCVNRQGTSFVWPIKVGRDDQRPNTWYTSAAEAATLAETRWIRMSADMNLGAYQTYEAVADLGGPKWPSESWEELIRIAVRDRRIDSVDHPVVRQLLGTA